MLPTVTNLAVAILAVAALPHAAAAMGSRVSDSTVTVEGRVGGSANALALGAGTSASNVVGGVIGGGGPLTGGSISTHGTVRGSANAVGLGWMSVNTRVGAVVLGRVR